MVGAGDGLLSLVGMPESARSLLCFHDRGLGEGAVKLDIGLLPGLSRLLLAHRLHDPDDCRDRSYRYHGGNNGIRIFGRGRDHDRGNDS